MWFLYFILVILIYKLYNKMTCGICKSDVRLHNKVAIVTGANTGIGYETARDFAMRGARVILACRDMNRARVAQGRIIYETRNSNVLYRHLDLRSLRSVRSFASTILSSERRLDILVNNAGTGKLNNELTEDGIVEEMQINHFGPFLLTKLLLPLLQSTAPSRVIVVSSVMHKFGKVDVNNVHLPAPSQIKHSQMYSDSKLCNILFTMELSRRLSATGVTVNCLHPGAVSTDIFRNRSPFVRFLINVFFKSAWEGAQTSIYLSISKDVAEVTGKYFVDCKPAKASSKACDEQLAKDLWNVSEKLVCPFFEEIDEADQ